MSSSTYLSDKSSYQQTMQNAFADSMDEVESYDIVINKVTDMASSSAVTSFLRSVNLMSTAVSQVKFTVSGTYFLTANQLFSQFNDGVNDGSVTASLNSYAVTYNAAALMTASASGASWNEANGDDDDMLSGGDIVGIVIGITVGLLLIFAIIYYVMGCGSGGSSARANQSSNTAHTEL